MSVQSRAAGRVARSIAVTSAPLIGALGLGRLCTDSWQAVRATATPSFDLLLGAVTATGACAVVAWCALVVVFVAMGSAPGRLGAVAERAARLLAPAVTRHRTRVILGITVTAAQVGLVVSPVVAAPGPAVSSAATATAVPMSSAIDDLPPIGRLPSVAGPPPNQPRHDPSPVEPAPTPEPPQPDPRGHPPARVTVGAGDTLWAIAADHLDEAAPETDVARAWPLWFAANRDVIGPDPDLIRPGMVLVEPTPTEPTSPE